MWINLDFTVLHILDRLWPSVRNWPCLVQSGHYLIGTKIGQKYVITVVIIVTKWILPITNSTWPFRDLTVPNHPERFVIWTLKDGCHRFIRSNQMWTWSFLTIIKKLKFLSFLNSLMELSNGNFTTIHHVI